LLRTSRPISHTITAGKSRNPAAIIPIPPRMNATHHVYKDNRLLTNLSTSMSANTTRKEEPKTLAEIERVSFAENKLDGPASFRSAFE
jgi:hypothetical protein